MPAHPALVAPAAGGGLHHRRDGDGWDALSPELQLRIFRMLPGRGRDGLRLVCSSWRRAVYGGLAVRLRYADEGADAAKMRWASTSPELARWSLLATARPLAEPAAEALARCVSSSASLACAQLECALPAEGAEACHLLGALGASGSLEVLQLQRNDLGSLAAMTLAAALRDNPRCVLRVLDLSQNNLVDSVATLGADDSLEMPEDSGDSGSAFDELCQALASHAPRLRSLRLGSCGLGPHSGTAVAALLSGGSQRAGSSLHDLHLSGNLLGEAGGVALAAALTTGRCSLRELELRRTALGELAMVALLEAACGHALLETLHLGGQKVVVAAAAVAGRLLRTHRSLKVLGLRRCLDGPAAAAALANLPGGPADQRHAAWRWRVHRLELQQSRLGPGGSLPLCAALSDMTADVTYRNTAPLELELELGWNNLSDADAEGWSDWMVHAVQDQSSGRQAVGLARLSLHDNPLGDEGGVLLGVGLKVDPPLRSLTLSECRLGDRAGKAIAAALEDNTQLNWLDLEANEMTADTAEAFAKVLYVHITRVNTSADCGYYGDRSCLRHLNLSDNRLGDSGVAAIAKAISSAMSEVVAEHAYEHVLIRCGCGGAVMPGSNCVGCGVHHPEPAAPRPHKPLPGDRYMGPSSLLLRNVEIHSYGSRAIGTAVVSPLTIQLHARASMPSSVAGAMTVAAAAATSPADAAAMAAAAAEELSRPLLRLPDVLRCSSVTELDLSDNAIGSDGVSALLLSLRMRALMVGMGRVVESDRPTQLELRLSGCDMTPAECKELAE